MRAIAAALLLILIVCSPASATTLSPWLEASWPWDYIEEKQLDFHVEPGTHTFEPEAGQCISHLKITVPADDTPVTLTLYRGGDSYSGEISYSHDLFSLTSNTTLALGGDVYSTESTKLYALPEVFVLRVGMNEDTGSPAFVMHRMFIGPSVVQGVALDLPDIVERPITKITILSEHPVDVTIWTRDYDEYQKRATEEPFSVGLLLDFCVKCFGIVYLVIQLFVDFVLNRAIPLLIMIELLIIGHAFGTARTPSRCLYLLRRNNEIYIGAIFRFISWVISLFATIIKALNPLG